ncbi:MAG TPA: hypothetical protein VF796_09770 [Humisphaera sp.]
MTTDWVLAWWNLVFAVPFGLALLYLVVYAVGGITFGDPDTNHDLSADHDVDADHDLAADHDADVDQDVDVDADADHDVAAEHDADSDAGDSHAAAQGASGPGPLNAALSWLGVGRVPLSLLLMVLMLAWGASGFVVNQLLRESAGAAPWRVALFSLPTAAFVALVATRVLVRAMDRWAPLDATTARRRHDLLGSGGTAIFPIDDRFGMAAVRDDRGELFQVPCRLAAGHPPVPKHGPVVLVAYNARTNLYQVIPADAARANAATGPPAAGGRLP